MADNSIRKTSATVDALSADWEMIEALMQGTYAMRQGAQKWLPQWPQEPDDAYRARLSTAVLHPVFKRTVLINAARPFSRPIAFGAQTPARVIEFAKNIDLAGSSIGVFAIQLMVACLSKGMAGVLVDYPPASGVRTQAEEKAVGARPYCVQYPAESILGWKTQRGQKGATLSQLRLVEYVEEPDGAYQVQLVEQVRVLEPGAWSVWRRSPKDRDTWIEHESGRTTLDFIPFVFFYGLRKGYGMGFSPLQDLAHQNVEHWQSASDQQTILHVARVPILFAKAFGEGGIVIGSGSAATSDNENAQLQYVEHSGAAIGAGKESLTALEDRMRASGAELISLDPGFATATEVSADGEASKSLMQQICEHFEESCEAMLNFMAAWVGLEQSAEVQLYKDFGIGTSTDPATLSGAVSAKTLSHQTHFEELKRRDVISPDREWEGEQERLALEADAAVKHAAQIAAASSA